MKVHPMIRLFAVVSVGLMTVTAASAQSGRSDPGCARDVSRFCRAVMDQGDMVVLGCLKQHRARLSKTCAKVLTDNNQ